MARILVIDDERDLLDAIELVLEFEGHEISVIEAMRSAEDALHEIQRFRPDVILLDWVMPRVDGGQVLARIRSPGSTGSTATTDVPVVVMSALANLRAHALEMGAAVYLPKPFELPELLAAIAVARETRGSPQPGKQVPSPSQV